MLGAIRYQHKDVLRKIQNHVGQAIYEVADGRTPTNASRIRRLFCGRFRVRFLAWQLTAEQGEGMMTNRYFQNAFQ
jgi:hypothetical protein